MGLGKVQLTRNYSNKRRLFRFDELAGEELRWVLRKGKDENDGSLLVFLPEMQTKFPNGKQPLKVPNK